MRIHTDTLGPGPIYDAARFAKAHAWHIEPHGSRSRVRAYEVFLEGHSPRWTQNDRDRHAATYDQWGEFLAVLYRIDPNMKAGPYNDQADFRQKTRHEFL